MQEKIIFSFGKRVKQLREMRGWSQEELAEKTGFQKISIAKIEKGETKMGLDNIEVFASVFRVDLSDLLNDRPNYLYTF